MRAGYHNHQLEFTEKDGYRPIQVIAANTPKDVTLRRTQGDFAVGRVSENQVKRLVPLGLIE